MRSVKLLWTKSPNIKEILSLNKIIYVLVASDLIIISAYGLIAPIFAVFMTQKIAGETLVIIGIAESIYLLSKSLIQVPLGIIIDKTKGQKIDFWFLFIGSLLMSISVFMYVFAKVPWHIYAISLAYGLGSGLSYPAWTGIFTRNMVERKESFAWSFSTTFVETGRAAAAIAGGLMAELFGFNTLFIIVGILSLIGTTILFLFYYDLV